MSDTAETATPHPATAPAGTVIGATAAPAGPATPAAPSGGALPRWAAAALALPGRWWAVAVTALVALTVAALAMAWNTHQRVKLLEAELVKRLQDSGNQSTEARTLSRQAESTSREVAAKLALVEARVAETSMQRGQLEELIQSLSRSRDENVLADLDAAIRVALQQTTITGSAEPLLLTLRQADERLARYNQPRLERVRRAVATDLEQARSAAVYDLTTLSIRIDEVMRQIDDLPLLSAADNGRRAKAQAALQDTAPAPLASASAAGSSWHGQLRDRWHFFSNHLWQEVKGLVRVSKIEQPEALLISPEQAYFLRENLKLRLLNARLSLLSRQFETAQFDLRDAQSALDRYFDRSSRRVATASDLIKQTAAQARQVVLPRPEATLAAIATAVAGR